MNHNTKKGTLYIVSAASGAGKTSLIKALLEQNNQVKVCVSYTTRQPRKGEVNGVDYFFVGKTNFNQMLEAGDFLEDAEVFGNFYGSSQQQVEECLKKGHDVILEIDWQGARQVRKQIPDSRSIYITPPSLAILHQRLQSRGQDNEATIARRMKQASEDISHYVEYDYLVINNDFDETLENISAIIKSERLLLKNQQHTSLLAKLLTFKQ